MGRRLALYSDILEKMSIGIDEYITYYSAKVEKYKALSELKTRYENSKNGYEASLMISYDYDSKDFHEKNVSKRRKAWKEKDIKIQNYRAEKEVRRNGSKVPCRA